MLTKEQQDALDKQGYKNQDKVGLVFILIALTIVGINMLCRVKDSHKYDDYKYTRGTVVEFITNKTRTHYRRRMRYRYSYSIAVEYSPSGSNESYIVRDENDWYQFLRRGKTLRVYYDEDDPEDAHIAKKDWLTGLYLPAETNYYIAPYIALLPTIIGLYLIVDYKKAKKRALQNNLKPKKKVKSSVDPDYDPNLHELARMSNYKRGWVPFWIGAGSFYLFTMVAGIMIIYSVIKDHPDDSVSPIAMAIFFMFLGHCMLAGLIVSVIYLKRKKAAFIKGFMADEATSVYVRREEAAKILWKLVKKYMEKETPWSRFKLEYNRDWLETYGENLEHLKR